MTTREEHAASAIELIQSFVPKFRTVPKEQSKLMKAIGGIFRIARQRKRFMEDFSTTVGYTAYMAEKHETSIGVILHEGRHAEQSKHWTRAAMGFAYLVPQILMVPGLIIWGTITGWSPWQFFLLGFLAPLPACWRMWWELDAYTVSIAVRYWTKGEVTTKYLNHIVDYFCDSSYWFMWPFRSAISKKVRAQYARVASGDIILDDDYFASILNWLNKRGLLHE